ncbi:unnamed protein product [marine sediment metagenome]|uniref:Uncharacterized protein n=1 Tax=marine sediment metagenome TaxID=412755 RepID=X1HEW3_9ZZZZ
MIGEFDFEEQKNENVRKFYMKCGYKWCLCVVLVIQFLKVGSEVCA